MVKQRFIYFFNQFNRLTIRERSLLAITGIVFILTTVYYQGYLGQLSGVDQAHKKIDQEKLVISEVEKELKNQSQSLESDPIAPLIKQKEDLESTLGNIESELKVLTDSLISPQQMSVVLEELLFETKSLVIKKVTNLPPLPMYLDDNVEKTDEAALFKHGLQIEFEASFANTIGFLEAIENLPWKILWESLDYQVSEYPNATVQLQVFTLSETKEWIGV